MASIANAESGSSVRAKLNKVLGFSHDDNLGRPALTANATIPRSGTKLRRVLADIEAGSRSHLNVMSIGDSLATDNWETVKYHLDEYLNGWFGDVPFSRYSAAILGTGKRPGQKAVRVSGTGTFFEKTDYDISFIGNYAQYNTSQDIVWGFTSSGAMANCDKIIIPIVRQASGGSLLIEIGEDAVTVGSATYRDPIADEITSSHTLTSGELVVSTDGSGFDAVVLEFSTMEARCIRITETGVGGAKTLAPAFQIIDQPCINNYLLSAGSNNFISETEASSANMTGLIDAWQPDVIIIESADGPAAYQNFLPKLATAISNSSQNPHVIVVTTPGHGTGFDATQAEIIERNDYCLEYAASRRWDVIDGLAVMGGIDELTANGWNADNIHLNTNVWRALTRWYVLDRGFAKLTQDEPGGILATGAEILAASSERPVQFTTQKFINTERTLLTDALHMPVDTGWMDWTAGTMAGSGSATFANQVLTVSSETTANSTARMYPGTGDLTFGFNLLGRLDFRVPGAMLFSLRLQNGTTNGEVFIGFDNGVNTGAYRNLSAAGLGWRILNNVLDGVGWTTSLQSTSSVNLSGDSPFRLVMVWGIGEDSVGANYSADFYVNSTYLGRIQYASPLGRSFGINVTNGADAARQRVIVRPPQIISTSVSTVTLNP